MSINDYYWQKYVLILLLLVIGGIGCKKQQMQRVNEQRRVPYVVDHRATEIVTALIRCRLDAPNQYPGLWEIGWNGVTVFSREYASGSNKSTLTKGDMVDMIYIFTTQGKHTLSVKLGAHHETTDVIIEPSRQAIWIYLCEPGKESGSVISIGGNRLPL